MLHGEAANNNSCGCVCDTGAAQDTRQRKGPHSKHNNSPLGTITHAHWPLCKKGSTMDVVHSFWATLQESHVNLMTTYALAHLTHIHTCTDTTNNLAR